MQCAERLTVFDVNPLAAADAPGAETDFADLLAGTAEFPCPHVSLSRMIAASSEFVTHPLISITDLRAGQQWRIG